MLDATVISMLSENVLKKTDFTNNSATFLDFGVTKSLPVILLLNISY
jgi:hypothetical protein